jgi:hypothetical protein
MRLFSERRKRLLEHSHRSRWATFAPTAAVICLSTANPFGGAIPTIDDLYMELLRSSALIVESDYPPTVAEAKSRRTVF